MIEVLTEIIIWFIISDLWTFLHQLRFNIIFRIAVVAGLFVTTSGAILVCPVISTPYHFSLLRLKASHTLFVILPSQLSTFYCDIFAHFLSFYWLSLSNIQTRRASGDGSRRVLMRFILPLTKNKGRMKCIRKSCL